MDTYKNKIVVAVIIVIIAAALSYFSYQYWQSKIAKSAAENLGEAQEAADKALESATSGALPSLNPENPLKEMPAINPAETANPFKNIKTNPFE